MQRVFLMGVWHMVGTQYCAYILREYLYAAYNGCLLFYMYT